MECQWNGCNQFVDDDLTAHIQKHIESQTEYACMWTNCKRYNEKQSNKYTLQAHVRKHTNEKPYGCTKCTRKYTRSDALNKHLKHHAKSDLELEENMNVIDSLWYRKRLLKIDVETQRLNLLRREFEIKILYEILAKETFNEHI